MKLTLKYPINKIFSMKIHERCQFENLGCLFCFEFDKYSDLYITKNVQNRLIKIIVNMMNDTLKFKNKDLSKIMYDIFPHFYYEWFSYWRIGECEFEIESIDYEDEELICMVILNYLLNNNEYFTKIINDHNLNYALFIILGIIYDNPNTPHNYVVLNLKKIAIKHGNCMSNLKKGKKNEI